MENLAIKQKQVHKKNQETYAEIAENYNHLAQYKIRP